MNKDFLKGINIALGILLVFSVLGLVSAVGFHYASEILPGTFLGNFRFQGDVNVTGDLILENSVTLGGVSRNSWPSTPTPIPTYYMNLGEDYYAYWNTDGGGSVDHSPHSDNCDGDNINPYVCPPDVSKSCLDSANTGIAQHHRRVICRTAKVYSDPGTHTMSLPAALAWEFVSRKRIGGVNNGACSVDDNCPNLGSINGWAVTLTGETRPYSSWDYLINIR